MSATKVAPPIFLVSLRASVTSVAINEQRIPKRIPTRLIASAAAPQRQTESSEDSKQHNKRPNNATNAPLAISHINPKICYNSKKSFGEQWTILPTKARSSMMA
ncbi:MAG: hypothetical protein K2N54_09000 [Helicobacter sp.]|nr:hypothetical protein [Helicobacter sp.]